jgi:ribosomal protein S18 acetylase RimI-like enzyme
MNPIVEIEAAKEVTLDLSAAMARLVPQLSSSSPPPDPDQLAEMVAHPGTTLFVAKLDDQIVGTLTLVVFRIPTGIRAWIEDVVVDEAVGGKGIGKALTTAAIDHAFASGARTVDLTSRPSREVANGMYQRLGFERRETNVYRYTGPSHGRQGE